MKLKLSFSPCPNDTFMFEALVNQRVGSSFLWDINLQDIEALNRQVLQGIPDVSKISAALYPQIAEHYQILHSGAALGNNNGPILISKKNISSSSLGNLRVAIPGIYTTANLLLSIAFPKIQNKQEVLFSEIENALLEDRFDAGLIIHESRFTYAQKGLRKIIDLGEFWEQQYHQMIPLGLIVVRRAFSEKIKREIDRSISQSIEYAFAHPLIGRDFIKCHAQELADEVIEQHINLYVNSYSQDMGQEGENSIRFLLEKGAEKKLINKINVTNWFV